MAAEVPDVTGPTIVHKVKSKLGYTEMHATAPGFAEEDLVVSDDSDKNWKGMTIALLVILAILASVAVAVVLMTPPESLKTTMGKKFSVKDVLDRRFVPRRFNGSWVSASELTFLDSSGGLSILNVDTMTQIQIVGNNTFSRYNVVRFSLSPSKKSLLLTHDVKKRHRFSTFAQYTVYDISSGLTWDVGSTNDDPRQQRQRRLLHAQWVPSSSSSSDGLVFVEDYTVYFVSDPNGGDRKKIFPLSQAGSEVVMHGVPDWTYEEEILKRDNAVWVSGDGRRLVYATFNDTEVEEVRWPIFDSNRDAAVGKDDASNSSPYPRMESLRYPKAGSTNPTATLWVVDLTNLSDLQSRQLRPPTSFKYKDYYFTGVSWSSSAAADAVAVNWVNRAQDVALVSLCRAPSWICIESFRETVSGWSTLTSPPLFSSTSSYVVKAPIRDGDAGFFQQLVVVEASGVSHPLAMGHTEVREILAWDEEEQLIYFSGIPVDFPAELHLFSVSSRWKEQQSLRCLTRELRVEEELNGRRCHYTRVKISPGFTHYVLECLGPDLPGIFLVRLDSANSSSTANVSSDLVLTLDNQDDLAKAVSSMSFPVVEKTSIPVEEEEGSEDSKRFLRVKLHLPPRLVQSDDVKYPLVLHSYCGPGHQLVTDEWKVDFNTFMTTTLGAVVAEVDGAGSGGQGHKLLTRVRGKLGQAEVKDQLYAAKYLAEHLDFVDESRIAVTGVSYGGYVAVKLLGEEEVFKCGVAVSPVVDWKFYSSAYSERYLGMPNQSEGLYERASLVGKAKLLTGKELFVAHGMADKNVHFQHGMVLAKELVAENFAFKQQVYPDEGHFLENVQSHLFSSVSQFLQKCFFVKPPEGGGGGGSVGGGGGEHLVTKCI